VEKKRFLIIHLSRLGDMLQSLPAIKLLKEEQPQSKITCLGIAEFCQILKNVPWIDNLVTIPWHEISVVMGEHDEVRVEALDRLLQEIPELNKEYDTVINLTHNWGSTYLSEKVKAREKTGRVFSENDEVKVSGKWGKYLFAMVKNQEDNLFNLVDIYMGMAGVANRPVAQYLPTKPETDSICISHLANLGYDTGKLSIGFQLGTNNFNKKWPLEKFVKLGQILINDLNAQIILFGSYSEKEFADRFKNLADYPFISLIGQTDLEEIGSYLKQIDVLVSNDTGPMHIAAAVGTKVVGIFSGIAYFGVGGPYGSGNIAIQSNYSCAPCTGSTACSNPLCRQSIKPETVAQGVKIALGREENLSFYDNGASLYKASFNANGTLQYQLINKNTDSFLPWLQLSNYTRAVIGRNLWSNWLGLQSTTIDSDSGKQNGQLDEVLSDFSQACTSYKGIYGDGKRLCQKIISEFQKENKNFQMIQIMVDSLRQVEERIKAMEGPLSFLKEIHGYYMAETKMCDFPELANEFLETYTVLNNISTSFETSLQQIACHR